MYNSNVPTIWLIPKGYSYQTITVLLVRWTKWLKLLEFAQCWTTNHPKNDTKTWNLLYSHHWFLSKMFFRHYVGEMIPSVYSSIFSDGLGSTTTLVFFCVGVAPLLADASLACSPVQVFSTLVGFKHLPLLQWEDLQKYRTRAQSGICEWARHINWELDEENLQILLMEEILHHRGCTKTL